MPPKSRKKVVIIGGGVAGMSAAHELIERGFDVTVYERGKIPGGKARSVSVPGTGRDRRPDLPGEHGFRIFPRFYRHITDTMQRIPYNGNPRGVYDNIVDTKKGRLARDGRAPLDFATKFPKTLVDVIRGAWNINALQLTPEDLRFFAARLWQIMTMCQQRSTNEYERLAWWDFLNASDESKEFQRLLAWGTTRTLVAADPRRASTHVGGNILWQIIYGGMRLGPSTDRLLNGPTNEVWIEPWLEYLRKLGVEYHLQAKVTAIHCDSRITGISVHMKNEGARWINDTIDDADYYIAAVPVEVMAGLLTPEMTKVDPTLESIKPLARQVGSMNGIQFYLNEPVPIVPGHVTYVDTLWALTSVSQGQFWKRQLTEYGDGKVRDVISVDISDWQTKGKLFDLAAEDCTREQIAQEVWDQLKASLNVGGQEVLKDCFLVDYFIAPSVVFCGGKARNLEPLLVNEIRSWQLRPEAFTRIPNFFLASDYVRTHTSLASMEAANEAARRAVNAIIRTSGTRVRLCRVRRLGRPLIFSLIFLPMLWNDAWRYARGIPWRITPPWWLPQVRAFLWCVRKLLDRLGRRPLRSA